MPSFLIDVNRTESLLLQADEQTDGMGSKLKDAALGQPEHSQLYNQSQP